MSAFVVLGLVSSVLSQEIGWEERLCFVSSTNYKKLGYCRGTAFMSRVGWNINCKKSYFKRPPLH